MDRTNDQTLGNRHTDTYVFVELTVISQTVTNQLPPPLIVSWSDGSRAYGVRGDCSRDGDSWHSGSRVSATNSSNPIMTVGLVTVWLASDFMYSTEGSRGY